MLEGPATKSIAKNTSDLVVLGHKELTLSNAAQSLDFTGITAGDVVSVEIRIRKANTPTDDGHIARFTCRSGDSPTAIHGMYLGDGDFWTITGNYNVQNLKLIATESGKSHIANIIYYGYAE